ncbi:hypothetical protein [Inediibacterium massiliense]|uniref:hypothetical protein n=1 Tax=Inediibacterium massiliense TaxID=1658111 RepID=UPI0006B5720B|nr:hypothetical protein [Inediibacterium massiliense]
MAKIKKNMLDLDTTLVELKFVLKGNRQMFTVHTIATEACNFVNWLNKNKFKKMSRAEKEMFDNQFYFFDDYKTKNTVCIERDSIKTMTIPFFIDEGEDIDFKYLVMN